MTDTVAGRYRIERSLGQGGMGEVFGAFDETLHRRVVLKVIRSDHQVDELRRKRFRREAQILSQLDHPNICRCHDLLVDGEQDIIILERIDGTTLKEALERGLSPTRTLEVAAQILDALVVAHAEGVVHRDLKPANVMLTDDGQVKVLDFGLAQLVTTDESGEANAVAEFGPTDDDWSNVQTLVLHTAQGRISGTLAYMSPEQARAEPVGAASDLYSLGLMLQELLTGKRCYPEDLNRVELLARAQRGQPLPITGVKPELRRLVERLQNPSPTLRPTAQEAARRVAFLRAAPVRRTRRLVIAALLLVAVAAGIKYTVDLETERRVAVDAREAARADRQRGLDLIGFMLGDLREKLVPLGRLDVLDDVGARAMDYFRAVPEDSLRDDELLRRSEALAQIAGVRIDQGQLLEAQEAADEALTQARLLVERAPDDTGVLKNLGNAVFFAADVTWQHGDLDGAIAHFTEYQEIAQRLVTLAPDEPEWRMEQAYAWTNLGAMHHEQAARHALDDEQPDARAHWDQAIEEFRRSLDVWLSLLSESPDDPALLTELADVQSWLGSTLQDAGRSAEALDVLEAELDVRTRLLDPDEGDMTARHQLATTRQELGRSFLAMADRRALDQFELALILTHQLHAHDPSNLSWKRDVAVSLGNLAFVYKGFAEPAAALEAANRALLLLDELCDAEPANDEWRRQRDQTRTMRDGLVGAG
jgi:serine/threonine-protein kinase